MHNFQSRFSDREKKLFFMLRFLVRLLLLGLLINVMEYVDLYWLQVTEARQVEFILNLFGIKAKYNNLGGVPSITLNNTGIGLVASCTGYKSLLLLISLIIAVPEVKWKKRMRGIMISIPIIYFYNLMRLCVMLVMSTYVDLNLLHDVFWYYVSPILILIIWSFWLKS